MAYLHMAMVQNSWYHFGVGAPPILGDWDVHWWLTGILSPCGRVPMQSKTLSTPSHYNQESLKVVEAILAKGQLAAEDLQPVRRSNVTPKHQKALEALRP